MLFRETEKKPNLDRTILTKRDRKERVEEHDTDALIRKALQQGAAEVLREEA
jgi:hypothetical protein